MNLHHGSNLSHSSDNTGSLTCDATGNSCYIYFLRALLEVFQVLFHSTSGTKNYAEWLLNIFKLWYVIWYIIHTDVKIVDYMLIYPGSQKYIILESVSCRSTDGRFKIYRFQMRSCCIALAAISSQLWWSRMEDNVRKTIYVCVCDWITLLYSRKLTEHCAPAIMEEINII